MRQLFFFLFSVFTSLVALAPIASAQALPELPTLRGSADNGWGVVLAQSLLNDRVQLQTPLQVDGKWGAKTLAAVKKLQEDQGLTVDGIAGKNTWEKLFGNSDCRYLIKFKHPKWTDAEWKSNSPLYESSIQIVKYDKDGPRLEKELNGSLKPDYSASQSKRVGVVEALKEHGAISNGAYELTLGFHKRPGGGVKPKVEDLKVKKTGTLRPCLVVNRDLQIHCFSNKPNKTTSTFIHIHQKHFSGF